MKFSIKSFFLVMSCIAAVYWFLIAKDVYESDSKLVVKSLSEPASSMDIMTIIGNPSARQEEYIAKDYLLSKSFAMKAAQDLKLKEKLEGTYLEFSWYLPKNATSEEFYDLWLKMVKVELKEPSGFLNIKVKALTAEDALKLNKYLLKESELFLNNYSKKIVNDQLTFIKARRLEIEKELETARKNLTEFQKNNKILDVDLESKEIASLISNLEAEHAKLKTELDSLRTTHLESSDEYKILNGKVSALKNQIDSQRKKLSKSRDWENSIEWASLKRKLEFLELEWNSALKQEEKLAYDTARTLKTAVVLEQPLMAQEATLPNRVQEFFTVLLISGVLSLLIWIVKGLIKEQKARS